MLIKDLRYGIRMLALNPGFTLIAVLTIGLGIGANTTIFSWINSTLMNPIPGLTHTNNLVTIVRGENTENPSPPLSYLDYLDLRERNQSFSGLMAYHDDWMALTGIGQPERIYGALTTANYFEVLGARPYLGRGFQLQEERNHGGAPVVVISYGLWESRFSGDRSILGKRLEINCHPYTIIGVAPPFFQGAKTGLQTDLWIPVSMDSLVWRNEQLRDRDNFWLNTLGRLKPGVSCQQAQEELNLLMRQIASQYPDTHKDSIRITLAPLWRSPIGANSVLYIFLPMLMAISGVVLLLACANVANLLLVRSVARRREIAIRLSLGASCGQLLRQFLAESLLLALLGGGAALLLTTFTSGLFTRFLPPINLPLTFNIQIDRTVLLVTLLFSILTGAIFGTLPALRSTRLSPAMVLNEEAGSVSSSLHKSRLASTLVVAQISLSMLLLVCAGLFIRSLQQAQRIDPGFDPSHVLLVSFDLLPAGYSAAEGREFDRQLLTKLETLPGVESATLADSVPLCFVNHTSIIDPEGYVSRPHESMEIGRAYVGPNYLRTMRIPLISGRDLSLRDLRQTQEVVVINQAMAERYWPGQDVLGKRIQTEGRSWTVVGISRNFKWGRLNETASPFLFIPLLQSYYPEVALHIRVSGDPRRFFPMVEKTIHGMNPALPLFDVATLSDRAQVANFLGRVASIMVGTFGLVALLLSAIGIYGVVAYTTRQRTHEIGIRIALGAKQGKILWLVLLQGLQLTLIGLALGGFVSLGLTRFLQSQLLGISPTDLPTFVIVVALLCTVALIACYIPARRAAKLTPLAALRCE
jgi:predicted permease